MSSSDATPQPRAIVAPLRARLLTLPVLLASAVLLVGALAGAVWHGARFVDHTMTALAVPFPLDGLEGTLLHEAWLLRAGEPLYQPLQPDRFVSSPYPPLHYAVLSLFAPQQFSGPHVFFDGRLVSLAAMLIATLCVGLIVVRLSRSAPAAMIAMGLWLAFPPVQLWATRIKADPLALALTTGGLLAMTFIDRPMWNAAHNSQNASFRRLALYVALVCFVAAYFTKQTAVVAPVAATLALLVCGIRAAIAERGSLRSFVMHRALWPALIFGTLYVALVGGIWLLLDALTSGQYTFHIWGLHRSEWWSFALMRKFLELLQPSWPLALLGIAGLALVVAHIRREPNVPVSAVLPACYLLVAPLTLFGSGEVGANHNHLLETQLALTLIGAIVAGRTIAGWQSVVGSWRSGSHTFVQPKTSISAPIITVIAIGLLATQLWIMRDRPAWYGGQFSPLDDNPARYVAFIRSQPGEVLADDVGLLVAAGRTLRYDDPSTMGPAVSSGVWDESTLLAEVKARRFSAIMLPLGPDEITDAKGRWSQAFIATLRGSYKPLYRDRITTYVPR